MLNQQSFFNSHFAMQDWSTGTPSQSSSWMSKLSSAYQIATGGLSKLYGMYANEVFGLERVVAGDITRLIYNHQTTLPAQMALQFFKNAPLYLEQLNPYLKMSIEVENTILDAISIVEGPGLVKSLARGAWSIADLLSRNMSSWMSESAFSLEAKGIGSAVDVYHTASTRQVASISRVSSNEVNETFISDEAKAAGWNTPYPADTSLRQIILGKETQFLRVFSGENPFGSFLVRYKEIANIINDPQAIRTYLGLKDMPTNIVDVFAPKGTILNVGRIGPQPSFGLMENSGFQYQLISEIPKTSFQSIRPIIQPVVQSTEYVTTFSQ